MTPPSSDDHDVVVVGGGPAGSTAATLVAKAGHSVLLLEKEVFPRYQIGESLLPGTVHGVCRLLDVTEELRNASFMPKHGGTFLWGANPGPWSFSFGFSPMLTERNSAAFQVERARFDEILLRNAAKHGVEVREGTPVSGLIEEAGRIAGVRHRTADGTVREARARFVVDASGNRSSLYRGVGERRYSRFFQNLALFGYFEGGKRMPGNARGNILCVAFDEGWFWYIPLTDTLTSVGAVVRREHVTTVQADPEAAYRRFIDRCPMIGEYLEDAERVTDGMYGALRVRKDYSYSMDSFWRPGLALAGDAACFVDPVFSTGVHLATYSGLLAARSVNSALAGMDERRAFTEFDNRYRREYRVFYEFLTAFYDMAAHEDSYFWQAKKITKIDGTELEAFASLVGGTTAEASLLLGDASGQLDGAVGSGAARGLSGDQVGAALFGTPVIGEARRSMRQIQMSLEQPARNGTPGEPITTDGLVPSADHLHWAEPDAPADRC